MQTEKKSPDEIYHEIKKNTPPDLATRVLMVMLDHKGRENRITRRKLVEEVFKIKLPPQVNLNNLTADRQIRRSIRSLQKVYPIIGSSADQGYWFADNRDDVKKVITENHLKAKRLIEKNNDLQRITVEVWGAE